jgi:hypothetical protein
MIRAQAPVVAAVAPAPLRVGGPPPPLPTLSPRSATLPRPSPARPNPVDAPAAPPLDDFLPVASPNAPAAAPAPRDAEDLLIGRIGSSSEVHAAVDRKMASSARPSCCSRIVAIWIQRNPACTRLGAPVKAVHDAEQLGAQSRSSAQEATQGMCSDEGSFRRRRRRCSRPSRHHWSWAGRPGEVSWVIGADTMLVTSLPNGSCQAITQGASGTTQVPATPPCMASSVDVTGGGHFDDSGSQPDSGLQP